jgi:hypothetical protein
MAMPETMRTPNDLDLVVSQEAYGYLRTMSGWTEVPAPSGEPLLTNGVYTIGTTWPPATYQELKERSWQSPQGIAVASLPDIYSWKQRRADPKDIADMELIRSRLHDPAQGTLSPDIMWHEIEAVRSTLPEHLQQAPEAIPALLLAANGLHTIATIYGDPRIGQINEIVGNLERPDYHAVAAYHNGFGLIDDLHLLQEHLTAIGATDEERLLAMAADANSDSVYGK